MVVTADDDEQLVVAVNRHVADAHDSFELEEVIRDAAGDAAEDADQPGGSSMS